MRLLAVREVAARLAVSPATIYKLCARGRLRSIRLGAALRIDSASVDEFLASGGDSLSGK